MSPQILLLLGAGLMMLGFKEMTDEKDSDEKPLVKEKNKDEKPKPEVKEETKKETKKESSEDE